jgi:4-amino-4-deoxy-L-arabinose transferase-like glycosyltransferase
VALARPWIGSPLWCSDRQVPSGLTPAESSLFRTLLRPCSAQRPGEKQALPPWYRSQALLGVAAWLVLVAGTQLLLRAANGRPTVGEAVAALGVAVIPAASDALIESFHPQDLLAVGLTLVALSQALRRRWLAVGLLLGAAVLCKQFAVLALPALVLVAPTWRARTWVVGSFLTICVAAVAPFWLADRVATWHALSGTYVEGAGVIRSATVVGLLDVDESFKLQIARDAPVLCAICLSAGVWWRARWRLAGPLPLIGVALACMASRLVFEVSVYQYYLLAVAVFLLVFELSRGRPPLWTAMWVVLTRYGILELPSSVTAGWVAASVLAASILPLAFGLGHAVRHSDRASARVPPIPAPGA